MYHRLALVILTSVLAAGCSTLSLCDQLRSPIPLRLQTQLKIDTLQMPDNAATILGPRLAVGANEKVIAAWRMVTSDGGGWFDEIYVTEFRRQNPLRITWQQSRVVSRVPLSGNLASPPYVTINSSGRAVVGWLTADGTFDPPALGLARFDGSQWQPEILNILDGQIGPNFDIRLLDDDRLVIVYDEIFHSINNLYPQVAINVSLGSVFTNNPGFAFSPLTASLDCNQPALNCAALGEELALRADGTGLVGWRQQVAIDPIESVRAAPVDLNNQNMPIGSDENLVVAFVGGSIPSPGRLALSVAPSGMIATAVQQTWPIYNPTTGQPVGLGVGIAGHVSDEKGNSFEGARRGLVQEGNLSGLVGLLDYPRVAVNRAGYALFAWLANPSQTSTLEARIWSPSGFFPHSLDSPPFIPIDSSVVPGDQEQYGPHLTMNDRRSGTFVYAISSSQNEIEIRWTKLYRSSPSICPEEWSVAPTVIDSSADELTGIDLAILGNGEPMVVWIRRESGQIVFNSAREIRRY